MKLFPNPKKTARPAPQLGRAEALACIPRVSASVQCHQQESGTVMVEYPFVVKPFLQAIFKRFNSNQPRQLSRKLQLDDLGSQVWNLIDGKKSVREIIESFATASTMTRQEAELSVTTFLRELGKRGLIILL